MNPPCGQCTNYDPILLRRGTTGQHGWCAAFSVYPHKEGPGQLFPRGVKRAEPGEMPKPIIVDKNVAVPHCAKFRAKK